MEAVLCTHCQAPCGDQPVSGTNSEFYCCVGCREVRALLLACGLSSVYALADGPLPQAVTAVRQWDVLDDAEVQKELLDFQSESTCRVRFLIPSVRCAACLHILEQLPRLIPCVTGSRLHFSKQELSLSYNPAAIRLSAIAAMLQKLGYAPDISLALQPEKPRIMGTAILQLAVAFFCFGNIMLLAFPEYLAMFSQDLVEPRFARFLMLLQAGLSIPVFVIACQIWGRGLLGQNRIQSLDLPIFLGISVIYAISLEHVFLQGIPGYLDSMSGLVFFLLLGRQIQSITYDRLVFDRDYRDYLPLGVDRLQEGKFQQVFVQTLLPGDIISLPCQSIVPCDCELESEDALMDHSFVTGEQEAVRHLKGSLIFAGTRVLSSSVKLMVKKKVSQSYICSLWQEKSTRKIQDEPLYQTALARWFTPLLLTLASLGFIFWISAGLDKALMVFCSVLIVACPCALALAAPIGLGLGVRQLARRGLYLRDVRALEQLISCRAAVFDKTGTLTTAADASLIPVQWELDMHRDRIRSLARCSLHPLSQRIYHYLGTGPILEVEDMQTVPNQGVCGTVDGLHIKIGSPAFTGVQCPQDISGTIVTVSAGKQSAVFTLESTIRPGVPGMLQKMKSLMTDLRLLSGDRLSAVMPFADFFPGTGSLHSEKSPEAKAEIVQRIETATPVLMLGDGVNDCKAFESATCSLAVIENSSSLFPSCGGIIDATMIQYLPEFLSIAKSHLKTVNICMAISLAYNSLGLFLAFTGQLQPVVCAVLMPLSSLSVIIVSTILSFKYSTAAGVPWKYPFSLS